MNYKCCDPCNHCGTDADGYKTEDRCPDCGERSRGKKVCLSCDNRVAWAKHLAENGIDVTCQVCKTVIRAEGDWVKYCSITCAVAGYKVDTVSESQTSVYA